MTRNVCKVTTWWNVKLHTYLWFAEPMSLTAMACLWGLPEKMKTMNECVSSARSTRCESSCAVMQFHLVWERIKSWLGIAHQDNQPGCHSHFCAVWHTRVSMTACQHPHTHTIGFPQVADEIKFIYFSIKGLRNVKPSLILEEVSYPTEPMGLTGYHANICDLHYA